MDVRRAAPLDRGSSGALLRGRRPSGTVLRRDPGLRRERRRAQRRISLSASSRASLVTPSVRGSSPVRQIRKWRSRVTSTIWNDPTVAEATIPIPTQLRRPHPFVTATREAAAKTQRNGDGRLSVGGKEGVIWMTVSRDQLRRALLVAQAIFDESQRRSYDVQPVKGQGYGHHSGVGVVIRGHAYTIEIIELQDKVPLTDEELVEWDRREAKKRYYEWQTKPERPTYKKVPNGYLRVSLPSSWNGSRNNFSEGPRGGIERRLPTIFEELERRAEADDLRQEEWARRDEQLRREAAERAERARLQRIEAARVERLKTGIASWQLARETREYVSALRQRLPDMPEEDRERVAAWCDWAEQWADQTDPVVNTRRIHGLDSDEDQL